MYQHLRLQIVINWFVAIVKKNSLPTHPTKKSFNQLNFKKKLKLNKTKPNNDENNSYDRIVAIPMRPFWFHLYVKKK